jgi:hypothetical protein
MKEIDGGSIVVKEIDGGSSTDYQVCKRNRRRLFHRLSGMKEIDGGSSTAYQV